jgi:hypothetical protein
MHKLTKTSLLLSLLFAAVALLPAAARAQTPGRHPEYLHALSDLRMARALLHDKWAWEPVRRDDDHAVGEIDAAIREIKNAAIDDGKNLDDHPPVDASLAPHDRFRKAEDLLRATYQDLEHRADSPEIAGLRDRAMTHIREALNTVERADQTAHWQ